MTNNLIITEYAPDDRDACADLFIRVYTAPPFEFNWLGHGMARQYFTDLENTPNSLSYVLSDGGAVVGVCLGQKETHFQNPGYKINEFFIDPGHQHKGLGSHFINELETILRGHGLKAMYLFTQRHMDSFIFYRKNDFIPNDETVHMARTIRQANSVVYTRTYLNADN
ncbi:MAG: GNAT family N-acetyltransferase [Clostridiales bacterium]|jgi:GNAT superfamily N-acetyltransferase|nr:GNAT family N-acetyltransferase [Clostridiales bacterium]